MIKIGNQYFKTYPISSCNLTGLPQFVYPTPLKFYSCPICGDSLKEDYNYAIPISKHECVKIKGSVCLHCNALFSTLKNILTRLESMRINKASYELRLDFCFSYDKSKYSSLFNELDSVYRQFTLCSKQDICTYTIVYDKADVDADNNIIHYSSKSGVSLLSAENSGSNFVTIDGKDYFIVKAQKRHTVCDDIALEIESVLFHRKYFNNEIPKLTAHNTVSVYNGHISCHKKHELREVRANITPLGDLPMTFFVEYCYDCDKFLLKYDDYKKQLKRYHFFPTKVRFMYDCNYNEYYDFYRAEKSPLALSGYTVNATTNLSTKQRQSILSYIIDYNILDKRKVLDYLEWFIFENHYNSHMEDALRKWEEDMQFVLNYRASEHPVVLIDTIVKK